MKILKIILIICVLITGGCSSDISVDPTEEIPVANLEDFNNEEGAKTLVTAVYSSFFFNDDDAFNLIGPLSIVSDNANKGSERPDAAFGTARYEQLIFGPSDVGISNLWDFLYATIGEANQALQFLPELDAVDESLIAQLSGEARFLRAYSYFYLVRLFGGVPLMERPYDPYEESSKEASRTRASVEDIYNFIEEDLEYAADNLKEKSDYSNSEKGRASVGAAHALLAKVALYRGNWEKAASETEKVVGYSLVENYYDNWKVEGINNEESIFEIGGVGGDGNTGLRNYTLSQMPRGADGWGWGFNGPSQDLVDAFRAEGDSIRLHGTVMFLGETLYDGRVVPLNSQNKYHNYKAYASENYSAGITNSHIKFLRYSEVLLIRAEALNELNDPSRALEALNKVRKRVDLPDVNITNQGELRKAIWHERRLELAMEWDRWFDLIRTGQAMEAMEVYNSNPNEDRDTSIDIQFIEGKHELYPIPQKFIDEVENVGGTIEQNPGY